MHIVCIKYVKLGSNYSASVRKVKEFCCSHSFFVSSFLNLICDILLHFFKILLFLLPLSSVSVSGLCRDSEGSVMVVMRSRSKILEAALRLLVIRLVPSVCSTPYSSLLSFYEYFKQTPEKICLLSGV